MQEILLFHPIFSSFIYIFFLWANFLSNTQLQSCLLPFSIIVIIIIIIVAVAVVVVVVVIELTDSKTTEKFSQYQATNSSLRFREFF